MKNKNKKPAKKSTTKAKPKPKKSAKKGNTNSAVPKPGKPTPSPVAPLRQLVEALAPAAREGAGFKIAIDRIGGDTIIGDLIVVFPRTRGVLQKHGLRLDVEEAGDIYMTLDAFAALRGVSMRNLISELEDVAKEPPPPPPVVPAVAAQPTA